MKNWIITGAINLTEDEKKLVDKLNFNQELNLHSRLCTDPAFQPNQIFSQLEYKTKRIFLRDPIIIYLERELMHARKEKEQLRLEISSFQNVAAILNKSNDKLLKEAELTKEEIRLHKETINKNIIAFEQERKTLISQFENQISNIREQWRSDQEFHK
mmetsp:Transcript_17037/g.19641  ORF Transcript_17037/g.19641 Transcript_17037/m.19641 type:complete len:158 (+) Transcript_17037:538-1011(+)